MTPISLLEKLIAIPSYCDSTHTERQLGEWIYSFLDAIPTLSVSKEVVTKERFNVVATTPGSPSLIIAVHMDTVQPKQGWSHDQFKAEVEGDKLSGLGALDTKGGMAALLWAIQQAPKLENITFLFYCDEEYDFLGMKAFLQKHDSAQIQHAIVIEPTNLLLWNAHRGIVEIAFSVTGRTGHAARPSAGVNANTNLFVVIQELTAWLQTFSDAKLGAPLLNCAYFYGGLNLGIKSTQGQRVLGKEGNNIADYAETVLDIRTTSSNLTVERIKSKIQQLAEEQGLTIDSFTVRHDFGALNTDPKDLQTIEDALKPILGSVSYLDPKGKGFSDGQLIQKAWGIPVVYIGPSGDNAHAPGEWVSLDSLEKLSRCFGSLFARICS